MNDNQLQILLIINPISGSGTKRNLQAAIERRIKSMGHSVEIVHTTGPKDATRLARQAAKEKYDAVFACGGDGTVNEVATGLINSQTALAILPNGSGNGLARHINLPIDPLLALKAIKKSKIVDCDYCTVNDIPFFCTFGLGFDAAVSHRFATSNKRGLITYLKSAVDEFIHFSPEKYSISIGNDNLSVEAFLIACCNASQYGNNAFIAPTASITDGVLDVTLVHSGHTLSQAMVGVELLAGSITKGGLIDTFRTDTLTITRQSPGIAHIDGEPVNLPEVLHIKCHRGGLRIISPSKPYRFRPILTPAKMFFRECGIRINQIFTRS